MVTRSRNFDLRGYNHVALVCKDMKKTVDFYEGILGFPVVKTLEFPGGRGQHFFFQVTESDGVAFFWFPDGPGAAPGIAGAGWGKVDESGKLTPGMTGPSAPTSMHHLSFGVEPEFLDEYRERLTAAGVEVTDTVRHTVPGADGEREMLRSLYFPDPDGIVLEFSAWMSDAGETARERVLAEV